MPEINDNTTIEIPIRNLVAIIAGVVVAVFAYTEVTNRISVLERQITILEVDLKMNSEFRIKWPRGEMGSLPADSEQFMLIEHLASELEKLTKEIESGQAPFDQQQKLQIDFMQKRIEHLEEAHEKIRNDIMDLIHQIGNIPQMTSNNNAHSGH